LIGGHEAEEAWCHRSDTCSLDNFGAGICLTETVTVKSHSARLHGAGGSIHYYPAGTATTITQCMLHRVPSGAEKHMGMSSNQRVSEWAQRVDTETCGLDAMLALEDSEIQADFCEACTAGVRSINQGNESLATFSAK
jgi:hypothetical protein